MFVCEKCGLKFLNKASVQRHKCQSDSSLRGGISRTRKRHSSCSKCHWSFSCKYSLGTHKKLHSPNNPHTCPVCAKPFTCAAYLAKHQQVHFKQIDSKFPSENPVELSSENIYSVKNRTWTPPEDRPYPCPVCPSRFSHEFSLRQHLKRHNPTVNSTTNSSTCAVCSRSFKCEASLNKHLQAHLVGNPLKKVTKANRSMRKRKWTDWWYRKNNAFSCSLCSSSFLLENTLSKHMKVHSTQ